MSNGTPCSSQLIWCETQVEKLEQQLTEWKELARNIDNQLRTELAAAQAREKVLRSLSNELLHQIDINDFTDSHGHSAKMLKAVHDVMKYNTQPTDDTTLNNLLAEGQAREKVLHGWIEDRCRFDSLNMDLSNWRKFVEEYRAFPTDDTALRDALKAERERCRLHDAADVATKAMCKAWQLGQTYWQQADSDSYKQNAKSAITQDSFNDLLDSTAEAIRALEDE